MKTLLTLDEPLSDSDSVSRDLAAASSEDSLDIFSFRLSL